MGLTNLDNHWKHVVYKAKERIRLNSLANLRDTIDFLQNEECSVPADLSVTDDDLEHIEGMLTESDEYISIRIDKDIYIKKNPNYKLNQSIHRLNNTLIVTNIISLIVAATVGAYIVAGFYKKDSNELPLIWENLNEIRQSEIKSDSLIQKVVEDSLYQKRHK